MTKGPSKRIFDFFLILKTNKVGSSYFQKPIYVKNRVSLQMHLQPNIGAFSYFNDLVFIFLTFFEFRVNCKGFFELIRFLSFQLLYPARAAVEEWDNLEDRHPSPLGQGKTMGTIYITR